MGVDDLPGMDTPENKGGRPKGSTKDKKTRRIEVDGDPYTIEDGDEYWEEVYRQFKTYHGSDRSMVLNIADHTHTLPRTVVENLHNREIHSFEEYADDPPVWFETHLESIKLKGINARFVPDPDDTGKQESASGVSSLIDNVQNGSKPEEDSSNNDSSGGSSLSDLID